MKKIIFLIIIFFANSAYAGTVFDTIFSPNINFSVTQKPKVEFKTTEQREANFEVEPDTFRLEYYNDTEKPKFVMPEWVPTDRRSIKEEMIVVCTDLNGAFFTINLLDEKGYIKPEYSINDRGNYYYYEGPLKYIFRGDGVYERVKECNFSAVGLE